MQWKTTAGPRQTKAAEKAIKDFRWNAKTVIEISDFGRMSVIPMMGDPCEGAAEAEQAIFDAFGGTVTAANYREIVEAYALALAGLKFPEIDQRTTREERQEREQRAAQREAERAAADAENNARRERLAKLIPPGAQAMIVAELVEDQSDSMTDYHGHKTTRRVLIGFRSSSKESFKALREAAARFPETAHLGPGLDRVTLRLVWDHYSNAKPADVFITTDRTNYAPGDRVPECWVPEELKTPGVDGWNTAEFTNEADADRWMAEHPAPCGTRWQKSVTSFEHRENYTGGGGNFLKSSHRDASGWHVESDSLDCSNIPELDWFEAQQAATTAEPLANGATVQKHFHTKRGRDFWLVVLPGRVDASTFERLRDDAKSAGGWYSRAWGKTPGGFGFDSEAAAQAWAATLTDAKPATVQEQRSGLADRFIEWAERCEAEAAEKRSPRRENTPKQQGQASAARIEAGNLDNAARAFRALADGMAQGTLPRGLQSIATKAAVLAATAQRFESSQHGYHQLYTPGDFRDQSDAAQELRRFAGIEGSDPAAIERANRLARLKFSDIPGFFPTPPDLVERVIEAADIREGMAVLEPSAGKGDLAEAARAAGGAVTCCEYNATLCGLLTDAGFPVVDGDFIERFSLRDPIDGTGEVSPAMAQFDRVVMNPPFERLQDIDHVRHAFKLLKPGGRLVAIMSAGAFSNSQRKAEEFREWFGDNGGEIEYLPADAFKDAFRSTGVQTVLVTLDKSTTDDAGEPLREAEPVALTPEHAAAVEVAIDAGERYRETIAVPEDVDALAWL